MHQQVWSRPAPLPAPAPGATWISLLTPVKTVVAANWAVISRCAPEIGAQVSARHGADITPAEEAFASAEALEKSRTLQPLTHRWPLLPLDRVRRAPGRHSSGFERRGPRDTPDGSPVGDKLLYLNLPPDVPGVDARRRVSVQRCKPCTGDMSKYLPASLTQYVLKNFSKKSLPYHVTQDDVSTPL